MEQVSLYETAKRSAMFHGLPTLSIRLSMAWVLLKVLGRSAEARKELLACREELPAGEPCDRREWASLMAECDRETSSGAED